MYRLMFALTIVFLCSVVSGCKSEPPQAPPQTMLRVKLDSGEVYRGCRTTSGRVELQSPTSGTPLSFSLDLVSRFRVDQADASPPIFAVHLEDDTRVIGPLVDDSISLQCTDPSGQFLFDSDKIQSIRTE